MASNLRRNRLTTRVAVLTMIVFLTLVGAALFLRQGAANASEGLKSGNEVTIWMKPDANAHEIRAVEARLARLSYLRQPLHTGTRRETLPKRGSCCPSTYGITPRPLTCLPRTGARR
jgi:hypothetical protein